MISIEALGAAGLSNKVLKRILTAKPPETPKKKVPTQKEEGAPLADSAGTTSTLMTLEKLPDNPTDWDRRCYIETMVRGEILEGQMRCAQNFDKFAAMDLAYSPPPIHPLMHDLMKVAMGYISLDTCAASLSGLSEDSKTSLFERDANGKLTGVNTPNLIPVSHNLVHSLVTRRVASAATELYQQYPLMKYEPYSNNQTGRCVADIMTQLGEQMAGAYNYRHDYEESIRQASLYTTSFKFKTKAWHTEKQTLPEYPPRNGATATGKEAKPVFKDKVIREGVEWVLPHPSRCAYDIGKPLSKLNSDLGPDWVNFFEVVPINAVRDDPAYFNTDAIAMDQELFSFFTNYASYFTQYYGESFQQGLQQAQSIIPTAGKGVSAAGLSLTNDRVANIGSWAQLHKDTPTVLAQHYKRIIPKNLGIGTYAYPVWIRFVMAANTTIVFSEIVGSAPATINSYNASDGLLVSPSFAMQAVQYQQMLTNDLNDLYHVIYQGMVEIWALNIEDMDKADVEKIVNQLKNPNFTHIANAVIKYSGEKLNQIGAQVAKGSDRLVKIQVDTAAKSSEIVSRMMNTLALAERLLFFSPQELGQVSPRTTSATEQKAIRDTTLGIRDWALVGAKQQLDADKRIIHDSYMAFGTEELEVPVAERYSREVIEKAGFEIVDDGTGLPPDGLFTVRGKKLGLYYNYTYTNRNTDDTPPEAAEAQALGQLYEVTSKDEDLKAMLTNGQRIEMFNAFAQKVSPNFPRINLPPGVDPNGRSQTKIDQLAQAIPQIGQALQGLQKKQAEQDAKIQQTDAGISALTQSVNRLIASLQPPKTPPVNMQKPTQQGQIGPDFPPGNGAPPLRVKQASVVPAIG